MRHKGNYLVVGHSRRSNDADHSRHASRAVLSSHDRERLELRVEVLVADADGDSGTSAALAQQVGEMLVGLGQRDELPHVVNGAELRLLCQKRRLPQQNSVIALNCRLEKLLAFFDEDVQQLGRFARRTGVAQPIAD